MDAPQAAARTTRAVALTSVLLLAQMAVLLGVAAPAAAQTAGPTITGVAYVDLDQDGLLDGAVVETSEPVLGTSVRPGDFLFKSAFTSFGTLDDERFARSHFAVPNVASAVLSCGSTVAVTSPAAPAQSSPVAPASAVVGFAPSTDEVVRSGHGLTVGTAVKFAVASGGSLPPEISPTQIYYVTDTNSDGNPGAFEISSTPVIGAGSATPVSFATAGSGTASVLTGYGSCFGIGFEEHHFWSTGGVLGATGAIFPDMYFTSRVLRSAHGPTVTAPATDGKFGGAGALDAAPPVLLAASGAPGDNVLVAIYSEQISNAAPVPQAEDVFDYSDAGNPIQGVAVTHVASSRALEVPLTNALVAGDIGTETLTSQAPVVGGLKGAGGLEQLPAVRTVSTPRIVSAHGDLAKPEKVVLTFNMPIQSVAAGSGGATQLTEADFFSMETGPQGNTLAVQRVEHRLGSSTAILTVQPPLSQGDLAAGSETKVRPRLDRITALGHPEDSMGSNGAPTDQGKAPIQAKIAPRISAATARDLDSNGFLDVIEVRFTKPIQDGTPGSGGTSGDSVNLDANHWRIVVGERGGTDDLDGSVGDFAVITKGGQNLASCSIESSLAGATDDNVVFLCWNQGTYNKPTNVCTGFCLGTGAQLAVDYLPPTDVNANQVKDIHENVMAPYVAFAAKDAAPPILLRAETKDLKQTATTLGRIDAYRLVFSEPVEGGAKPQEGWSVQGRTFETNAMAGTGSVWTLSFNEIEFGTDTATTPHVTFTPTATNRWKDFYSNDLLSVTSTSVTEVDGVAPVVVRIEGEVGSSIITFQFSEGVRELPNGLAIDPAGTLEYLNEGPGDASAPMPNTFSHSAGAATATWRLNAPITAADIATGSHDKVLLLSDSGAVPGCPTACSNIVESSSSALSPQTVAPGAYRIVPKPTVAQDSAKPDDPRNLKVLGTPTASYVNVSFEQSHDDIGPVSYIVAYSDKVIDTVTKFDAARNAATPKPELSQVSAPQGGIITARIVNIQDDTSLFFAIRAADASGKTSNGVSWTTAAVTIPEKPDDPNAADIEKPATITALETSNVKATSFEVSFAKPADNRAIVGYSVKVASSNFNSFTEACDATTCDHAVPAGIKVGAPSPTTAGQGDKVTLKISGLDPETTYYVSVRAFDAALNTATASPTKSATTIKDTTSPPAPANLAITPETDIIELEPVTASWSPVVDPESDVTQYLWVVNDDASYTVTKDDGVVTQTQVSLTNLVEGENWFHVAARSAGGVGPTARIRIDVSEAPPELTTTQLKQANGQIEERVSRSGDDVEVSWTLPASPPAPLAGVQVWCVGEEGATTILETIEEGTGAYRGKRYIDRGATCDGSYVVTGYYMGRVGQGVAGSDLTGYVNDPQTDGAALESSGSRIPAWLLFALLGVAILIVVAILFFVLRRRGGGETGQVWKEDGEETETTQTAGWTNVQQPEAQSEEPWDAPGDGTDEPAWAEEEGEGMAGPAGTATAGAAAAPGPEVDENEIHQVTCPQCDEVFVAEGRRPLRIECPNCGVQGML